MATERTGTNPSDAAERLRRTEELARKREAAQQKAEAARARRAEIDATAKKPAVEQQRVLAAIKAKLKGSGTPADGLAPMTADPALVKRGASAFGADARIGGLVLPRRRSLTRSNHVDVDQRTDQVQSEPPPPPGTTVSHAEFAPPDSYDPSTDTEFTASVEDALQEIARDETRFRTFIEQTFGPVAEEKIAALRNDISNGQWDSILPDTQMVEFDLDGINGAYAPGESTIYLQSGDPANVRTTYLEELGHHLQHRLADNSDAALNDNLGDEGRIFALQFTQDDTGLVTGIDESVEIPDELRAENDTGFIQIAGPDGGVRVVRVEFDGQLPPATPQGNAELTLSTLQTIANGNSPRQQDAIQLDAIFIALRKWQPKTESERNIKNQLYAILNPNGNTLITLLGIREQLVNVKRQATDPTVRGLIDQALGVIDESFPLPTAIHRGSLGSLALEEEGGTVSITGRPQFSNATQAAVPSQTGHDRRHITAWHTLRAGTEAILNDPNSRAEFVTQLNAEFLKLRDRARTDGLGNLTVSALIKDGHSGTSTDVLNYLGALYHALPRDTPEKANMTVSELLAMPAVQNPTDLQAAQTYLFMSFNNPANLWSGPSADNQNLPSLEVSVRAMLNRYSNLENPTDSATFEARKNALLEEVGQKRLTAKTNAARGTWELIESILEAEPEPGVQPHEKFANDVLQINEILTANASTDLNLPTHNAPHSRWEVASTLDNLLEGQAMTSEDPPSPITLEPGEELHIQSALELLYQGDDPAAAIDNVRQHLEQNLTQQTFEKLQTHGLLPQSSNAQATRAQENRAQYLGWAPSKFAAAILTEASATPEVSLGSSEISQVVNGFLTSDPMRNAPQPIFEGGTEAQRQQAEATHNQLLESSPSYREAFLAASWNAPHVPAANGLGIVQLPLKIRVAPEANRVASYDPDSHTINLKFSSNSDTARDKFAVNLAFEMTNAAKGSDHHRLQARVEGSLARLKRDHTPDTPEYQAEKERIIDRFVQEMLDLERRSIGQFGQIKDEVDAAPPSNTTDNFDNFVLDEPTPGDGTSSKPTNEEFYREQVTDWVDKGDTTTDFSFIVWKPRGGTLGTPADPTDPTPPIEEEETPLGGGGYGYHTNGGAHFLQDFSPNYDRDHFWSYDDDVDFSVDVGNFNFDVKGQFVAGVGGITNSEETSGQLIFNIKEEGSVGFEDGPVSLVVTVGADGTLEGHIKLDHDFEGDLNTVGIDAQITAATKLFAELHAQYGQWYVHGRINAGAGAAAGVTAKLTVDGHVPGVTWDYHLEWGASREAIGTIGNDNGSATAEVGVIAGFSAGGGYALGAQPDGKFHVMVGVEIAFGGGFSLNLDLAINLHETLPNDLAAFHDEIYELYDQRGLSHDALVNVVQTFLTDEDAYQRLSEALEDVPSDVANVLLENGYSPYELLQWNQEARDNASTITDLGLTPENTVKVFEAFYHWDPVSGMTVDTDGLALFDGVVEPGDVARIDRFLDAGVSPQVFARGDELGTGFLGYSSLGEAHQTKVLQLWTLWDPTASDTLDFSTFLSSLPWNDIESVKGLIDEADEYGYSLGWLNSRINELSPSMSVS